MLPVYYDTMISEVTPIVHEATGFFNNVDHSSLSADTLIEWQNTFQMIGDLIEKKYLISEDSPCIHHLEEICEVLYQISINPEEDHLHELVSLLESFDKVLSDSANVRDSKLSIVAIMKNEGQFLDEWICYHLIKGVDHFYLYNNESTDNTDVIMEPYVKKGLVTLIDIPGSHVQKTAYEHALSNFRLDTSLMAFIDLDEFIVPKDHTRSIPDVVREILDNHDKRDHKWKKAGGVGLNWIVYGTGHHKEAVDGLVTENYLYHASSNCPDNSHIKVIVNPIVTKGFPNSSHNVEYMSDEFCTISERGSYIDGSPFFFDASYEWMHVNHYSSKSESEFIDKICRKGWPDQEHISREVTDPLTVRLLEKAKSTWNEIHDTDMVEFAPLIKEKIKELRG